MDLPTTPFLLDPGYRLITGQGAAEVSVYERP